MEKVFVFDHELISPIALGKENIIKNLTKNSTADGPIVNFEVNGLPFQNAAEVREKLTPYYKDELTEVKELCVLDRKLELLAAAFGKSHDRLAPLIAILEPSRTGVILGVGAEILPLKEFETQMTGFIHKKQNAVAELIASLNQQASKYNVVSNPYDLYSTYLAEKFNAKAFQESVLTACVSSTQALSFGYDAIAQNRADVVIAGGTDSIINLIALISFGKLGVIAESDGKISCRPFDNNRYGTIAGEAAGFAILMSEKFMKRHQLKPIAQILGYGNTLDGYKITVPDPSHQSMTRAIRNAIKSAGIASGDIDFYYAHGTGTRQNDGTELKAFYEAIGKEALRIPIASTKDRHGHAIAAAGIQEFSILMELMRSSFLPGNLNLINPLNSEMNLLRENTMKSIQYAITSNFSFGGINTVITVKNEL